jgi:hypothetical protein
MAIAAAGAAERDGIFLHACRDSWRQRAWLSAWRKALPGSHPPGISGRACIEKKLEKIPWIMI